MRHLLILGGGTAGTMVANRLRKRLPEHTHGAADDGWQITVVDRDDDHQYQPGYLFVPFDADASTGIVRSRRHLLADGVRLVYDEVDRVLPDEKAVRLLGGRSLDYDYLVLATGATPRPEQTPGMLGPEWRRSIFDFYTLDGARALATALERFERGRLVVHVAEMPIKCPVAPLEFTFLAEARLRERGIRDQVELVYVTPLDGAFTQPVASTRLGHMLDERKVEVVTDFMVERVDPERRTLVSYDEREVPFDLLVTVPVTMGADFVARSGLGDELQYVPVDKHTFVHPTYDSIFAIGDASNIPASKAGSVAHFSVEVFVHNFLEHIEGRPMTGTFDGHANCFVEAGDDKALLIDFNYDTEPLPGKYPLPLVGPLSLLEETRANHLGKLAFRQLYWHVLLPGHPLPLPAHMSMAGKRLPAPSPSHQEA
jgi:sulfide:quinone oxidoreductase